MVASRCRTTGERSATRCSSRIGRTSTRCGILRRALREAGSDIAALAHITGGGWEGNVPRTLPPGLGVEVDTGSWPVPADLHPHPARGDIADEEMVRTFNVGIGMTAVVPAAHAEAALAAVPDAYRIGRVVEVPEGQPRVRFA